MKRTILTTALLLIISFATTNAQSNTHRDSTVVICHPDTVKITNNEQFIAIEVNNNGNEYKLKRELTTEGVTVINEKQEWNFDIPFTNKRKKKEEKRHNATMETNILCDMQFGIGLVTATNQAEGMDVKMANCGMEFTLNRLISIEYRLTRNSVFETNFGVNWRNYRMKGENRFLKEGSHVVVAPYPDGADINFSRLKIFSLTTEVMLRRKCFGIGAVVNFNTHGSLKTRYRVGDERFKETSNNIHQNAVTIDYKAEMRIKDISFYFKYSPVNMLDTSYGPKFHSMSAGMMLNL
ncbi:MAG: hypothetical protein IKU35_09730 [Bacteroidaceae bacterium]|nr:hypothetical protein [Bacteroidaceae bacterium]